jgi:hypothetical protein
MPTYYGWPPPGYRAELVPISDPPLNRFRGDATLPITDPKPCGPNCEHQAEIRALQAEIADLRLRVGPSAGMAPLPPPPISPCTHPAGHFWVNLSDYGRSGASHCPRCKQWNTVTIITRG